MKIPFLQHIGVGLQISEQYLRWVELSRIRDRIKVRKVTFVEVENGATQEALLRLVERVEPDYPFVTVNLDSAHIRQLVVEVPVIEDEEYFDQWIDEQVDKMLPSSLNKDEFMVTRHLFGEEGAMKALFILARKELIHNRKRLLNAAGLQPVGFTSGGLEAGYTMLFNESFPEGETFLLSSYADTSTLSVYRDGLLHDFRPLNIPGQSLDGVIDEVEVHMAGAAEEMVNNKILLATDKLKGSSAEAIQKKEDAKFIYPIVHPLEYINSDEPMKSEFALAAGMAVKQLYPDLDTINLLEQKDIAEAEESIHKKEAIYSGAVSGGLFAVLLLLLMISQFFIGNNLEETSKEIKLLEDKITAVNSAKDEVKKWQGKVQEAQQLVAERTQVAALMEQVGSVLPEKAWYNEIEIAESGQRFDVILYGFSRREVTVAQLMGKLEGMAAFRNVRLILSEEADASDLDIDLSSVSNVSLVRFQIRFSTDT